MSSNLNVDTGIAALYYLSAHPESTTSDIAKAIFNPESKEELRSYDSKVRYHLDEKYDHLIEKDTTGTTTYSIIPETVYAGVGTIDIQTFDGHEVSIGLGGTLVWFDKNGEPHVDVLLDVDSLLDNE